MSPEQALCNPKTESCHAALQHLRDVLDHLGFTVRKKPPQEATLRVYPNGFNNYPLLNPRFEPTATSHGNAGDKCVLVFTVLSKGDELLDQHLRRFASIPECEFLPDGSQHGRYFYHGDFLLPVSFTGTHGDEVDFGALGESLKKMRQHLQSRT